ncbi:MAG: ferredoxin [Methanoregulaceae archaeon]|nr:ferredoxin [Methanoregulaceae archaeon]
MIRVTIDRGGCVSCGSCWDICPSFFEQNPDDTFSQVIGSFRISDTLGEGDAPDDLDGCVRDASDACPVQVIAVGE